ncbi:3-hydroxyacyl-ACP dehydratase [Spiribacter salinus M19-40]|uniref:3-hydroxyacyl-[acyl-carrier-protein] dehydratase FabZ n=2 Tax=Spiribacter salinus TaxID=1335746 RepID=R4VN35_9GAMM|nr:3-hydroxyacyl-ACP dehydratase FabZ [Spiribacter salinus]AGM40983.1 3-hydroxyacyl-ACP dehydratase [Spiribacter salinus M19-40]MDR9413926.1 3-hydroxyacyl-ACP dehydratase FabZ [Spiribacter sp.]MDR9454965.1 3-hydroxyacyl-ACP dehydratase FabZ [Spiribacter sp.]TQF00360.1 MAG: beta-hydroxyacyl-ACP dehydratase [Spiribacter salinus]
MTTTNTLDLEGIKRRLPHRYPFLLVDRVVDYVPGESLHARKQVSANEPWVTGHFPGQAIMPGVLLTEAMAQACGLMAFVTREAEPGSELPPEAPLFFLVGVDNARFKRPVEPGDTVDLRISLGRVVRGIWLFEARAEVDGNLAASAGIRCTMKEM